MPEADRLVKSNGTKVMNGDFEVYIAATDISESDERMPNEFTANTFPSEIGDDTDVLNRTHERVRSQALDGANRSSGTSTRFTIESQPRRFGYEIVSVGKVSHELLATFLVSKTGKDTDIHLATEAFPFGQSVLNDQSLIPVEILQPTGPLLVWYFAFDEVKLHAISLEVNNRHLNTH